MSNENQKPVMPPPGIYEAKIVNYGIKKTKAGDPAPTIVFEVELADKSKHRVYWQGSFKGGGREITLEALVTCGLTDIRAFVAGAMVKGPESGLLDMQKDIRITVVHEVSQEDPNKRYARVQWINEAGGGKFKNAIENAGEASMLLQGLGLEADFFRIAQEKGIKPAATQGRADVPPAIDIPF